MGQGERAFAFAQEGIALGERLESPFITAVGHMRLGHALQLGANPHPVLPRDNGREQRDAQTTHFWRPRTSYGEAIGWYRSAIALGDSLAVRRTCTEAMWGLTRAYGYGGDLELAASTAAEGVEIALEAGDIWLVALTSLALGASHVLAGKPNVSIAILTRALGAFRECNDTFGRTACRLWLALAYLDMERGVPWANVERASSVMLRDAEVHGVGERHGGAMSHFLTSADDLLALCETNGYNFLFTGPSLLGPPDERRLVPLMLDACAHHIRPAYVGRLLALAGLPDIQVHPGYQLRVQMLGAFRAWRGKAEIAPASRSEQGPAALPTASDRTRPVAATR